MLYLEIESVVLKEGKRSGVGLRQRGPCGGSLTLFLRNLRILGLLYVSGKLLT